MTLQSIKDANVKKGRQIVCEWWLFEKSKWLKIVRQKWHLFVDPFAPQKLVVRTLLLWCLNNQLLLFSLEKSDKWSQRRDKRQIWSRWWSRYPHYLRVPPWLCCAGLTKQIPAKVSKILTWNRAQVSVTSFSGRGWEAFSLVLTSLPWLCRSTWPPCTTLFKARNAPRSTSCGLNYGGSQTTRRTRGPTTSGRFLTFPSTSDVTSSSRNILCSIQLGVSILS